MGSKEKEVKKDLLASRVIKKANQLKREGVTGQSLERLSQLIRIFLKRRYKIKESLTLEEIIKALETKRMHKNLKIDLIHLLTQLHKLEYETKNPVSQNEYDYIVELTIKTVEELSTGKLTKSSLSLTQQKPAPKKTFSLLEEQLKILDRHFKADWRDPTVRTLYAQVQKYYKKLNDEEKRAMYPKIIKLFRLKAS